MKSFLSKTICLWFMLSFFANSSYSKDQSFYDISFRSIDGETIFLSEYTDKVILVVNTASFCGFTNQFNGIQFISDKYKDRGLVVIGVPSNDFGQEAKTNDEVKQFCEINFNVDFIMTETSPLRGEYAHPLFKFLISNLGPRSAPKWNFYKYIINRDGQPLNYYSSMTKPSNKKLIKEIELALIK